MAVRLSLTARPECFGFSAATTAHNTGAQSCWLILLGTDGQTEKGGSLRQDVPGCNKTLTFFASPTCSLSAPRREMRRSAAVSLTRQKYPEK